MSFPFDLNFLDQTQIPFQKSHLIHNVYEFIANYYILDSEIKSNNELWMFVHQSYEILPVYWEDNNPIQLTKGKYYLFVFDKNTTLTKSIVLNPMENMLSEIMYPSSHCRNSLSVYIDISKLKDNMIYFCNNSFIKNCFTFIK
jgi:hypothetical protein